MEKTPVDAVGMTRRIREAHAEQLKNASVEERIAFYREKARRLHEELAQKRASAGPAALRGSPDGLPTDFEREPDREF